MLNIASRVSTNLYSRLLHSYTPLSLRNDLPHVYGRFALGRSGPHGWDAMTPLREWERRSGCQGNNKRTKEEDLKVILLLL